MEKAGRRSVVTVSYQGKKMNSPNDVVVKSYDTIYFTDPPFGLEATHSKQELPYAGVYRVKGTQVDLLIKDLETPNGLVFSPFEKFLYVANWRAKTYMRSERRKDGTWENGKVC